MPLYPAKAQTKHRTGLVRRASQVSVDYERVRPPPYPAPRRCRHTPGQMSSVATAQMAEK